MSEAATRAETIVAEKTRICREEVSENVIVAREASELVVVRESDRLWFASRPRGQGDPTDGVAVPAIDMALVDWHALARHPRQIDRDNFRAPLISERLGFVSEDDVGPQAWWQGRSDRYGGDADMHEPQCKRGVKDVIVDMDGDDLPGCNPETHGAVADAVNEARKPGVADDAQCSAGRTHRR